MTIADLSKERIMYLLDMAREFEKFPNRELLKGKVVATLFFEPSTRTRLSFETAANRLGARVIGFTDAKASSVSKGETLKDTLLMVSTYADIIYMTRVQKERFSDLMEYERVKNIYILKSDMLGLCKPNMRVLHPLPRVNEIAYDVDENPHAYYIQQAQNGLYARQALFCYVLGIDMEQVKNDSTIL